jgi:hypothetical protein
VVHHGQQPSREAAGARVIPGGSSPQHHERVLHSFLSQTVFAADSPGQRIRPGGKALIQQTQRLLITRDEGSYKLAVSG